MLEHIRTDDHTLAMEKILYHTDGEILEESDFLKKHNQKNLGKKRSTDVRHFFQPLPKKLKPAASLTTITSSQRESAVIVGEVTVLWNSWTPPPLPNNNTFFGNLFNCNGAFREKYAIENNIQTDLRATSQFYVFDDDTRKIKSVPDTTFLNVFSSNCTINTDIR